MWGTQRKKRRTKKRNRTDVDFSAIVREEGEDQREISLQGAADAFLRQSSRTRYTNIFLNILFCAYKVTVRIKVVSGSRIQQLFVT
jgi:hypothetical protein